MQALALDERVGSTQDRRRRCAPTQGATVPERRTRAPGRDSKQANRQPPLKTAARRHRAAKHGAAAPPGLLRGLGREAEAHGPPRAPHLRPGPVYNERADRGRPPVGLGLPAPPRAPRPTPRPSGSPETTGARSRTRPSAAASRAAAGGGGDGGRASTRAAARGGAARPTRALGRRAGAGLRLVAGPGAPSPRGLGRAGPRRPPRRPGAARAGPFRAVPGKRLVGPGQVRPTPRGGSGAAGRVEIPGRGPSPARRRSAQDAHPSPTAATSAPVDGAGARRRRRNGERAAPRRAGAAASRATAART